MALSATVRLILKVVLGTSLALPLVVYPFLYLFQERLLFYPRPVDDAAKQYLNTLFPHAEVRLRSADNILLQGWLIRRPTQGQRPLLIYFGGNAEEISGFLLEDAMAFPQWAVLSLNYRGYGESQGTPGEEALFRDARQAYDWAIQQNGIDRHRVVVMGRSLGSGVAVHLAAERPVAGVVLVSPYDSVRSVAQARYFYAPISWLLKHPFDSLSRVPEVRAPMLMLISESDRIIPIHHAKRLAAAWGGPHTEKQIMGTSHNTINTGEGYLQAIRLFLEATAATPSP